MKKSLKNLGKSKILMLTITIFLLIIFIVLFIDFYNRISKKLNYESNVLDFYKKNSSIVFSIDKIVFFSSCDSKNKNNTSSNFTLENLYSYTDIALFINNTGKNDFEHTLKSVKISNIKFNKMPEFGTPKLCYKPLNNFAKSEYIESSIDSELEFNISNEDTADFNTPTLFNNCANPITLSYINENIKTDYTILDTTNPVTYNGSLLKRCFIPLNSINCSLSFDIYIKNNRDQNFKTTMFIDIPYEDNDKSIYDGNLIIKKDTNIDFYRYD